MKKLLAALGLALGCAAVATPASAAVLFSFSPASSHIGIGESVLVEMRISGLSHEILSGYDLNFRWDAGIAQYGAVNFLPVQAQLGADHDHLADTTTQGNYGVMGVSYLGDASLAAVQDSSFLFGTFELTGLADGATTFTLGSDPAFERNFLGRYFETLDVQVGSACIAVGSGACASVVPEPGSLGLVAAALAGAFGVPALRRRRPGAAAA